MELFIGAIIGLCFFIVPIWAYRKGLKDGLNIKTNKPLEPIRNPVEIVQEVKEEKKLSKEEEQKQKEWNEWNEYGG
ncbi:MAG: hypothetical protein N4A63_16310 [Vallitalea sp.]|jgi:hypothetical protein|nr:hypothetical protein [Vallitalea sp.]